MRRKLVSFDAFKKIQSESISHAESEMVQAEGIIARAIGEDDLSLKSISKENVVFETLNGTFVNANYVVTKDHIELNNIEELALDESSEQQESKTLISNMLESLLDDKEKQAEQIFLEYMSMPYIRRTLTEGFMPFKKDKKHKGMKDEKKGKLLPFKEKIFKNKKKLEDADEKKLPPFMKSKKKKLEEWSSLCENVAGYIEYKEFGPVLRDSEVGRDNKGNIVSVKIPSSRLRNEHKMLSFDWKVLDTEVKVMRNGAKMMTENMDFCKAMAELKRHNNVSDNDKLEEMLENIVGKFPSVLYLTQSELAESIKTALETARASNYDDQTCEFMAEAVLRTAHSVYTDKTNQILKLANAQVSEGSKDSYAEFKAVVDTFYPKLDEANTLDMQVFADLYNAIRTIHEKAVRENNLNLKAGTVNYLRELSAILNQEIEPDLSVASEATEWLANFIETNLETQSWNVSNTPHETINGDHPQMHKNARHSYDPASDFSGDWGDPLPTSDGKTVGGKLSQQMRNNSYGNIGGSDTYPELKNPYVPEPFGSYEIKGEKTIDSDSDLLGHWGGSDTWPALQNPYVPKAETPSSYKMKNGPETDLVVDK